LNTYRLPPKNEELYAFSTNCHSTVPLKYLRFINNPEYSLIHVTHVHGNELLLLLLLFLLRRTAGYTGTDYKTNAQITKELKITPILDKLKE